MFRFVSLLATILACTQFALGSNLHGALYAPTGSIISGSYGHGAALTNSVVSRNIAIPSAALTNSVVSRNLAIPSATSVISSHGSTIVHPNSAILQQPTLGSSIPYIGRQQYISAAPLTRQISSSPLISSGIYGSQNAGLLANSYATQRAYTAPLAGSGYSTQGLYSAPIVANAYGAQLGQAHGGIRGHLSAGW